MPGSVVEGKQLVKDFIIDHDLRTFLDIGPGEATYYNAFEGIYIDRIDGVEVWAPYVAQYELYRKYNQVIIADISYLDWDMLPLDHYDLVLLGDVIEHMSVEQGREVVRKAADKADYVALSLPIYGYAQNVGYEGNWFETHVEQYSDATVKSQLIKGYHMHQEMQGEVVGVYIFQK